MCNLSNCNHDRKDDDLDDGLDGLFSDMGREAAPVAREPLPAVPAKPLYEQRCFKCNGTGRFTRGYTFSGPCFACKGTGKQMFKTSPAARAASRESAQNAKDRKARESVEAFMAAHPKEWAWMMARGGKFDFALKMLQAVAQYGDLSERQLATVTRLMLQDEERDAARTAAKAEAEAKAVAVDITPIMKAMETAMANDIKRPLLRAGDFKFAYKPGVIYVRNRSGDIYYGKIVDGRFFQSRDCTAEDQAKIVEVASDPMQAAIAYGRREGACAICGRTLTNHESIDRGIGPICAENFGW
jgi:hypothetical protein